MSGYLSAAGGNYYATATTIREDGMRFGEQVARQRKTLTEARRALDETGLRGYVQRWNAATNQRDLVAERDEAGNWWAFDRFTGNLLPLPPLAVPA